MRSTIVVSLVLACSPSVVPAWLASAPVEGDDASARAGVAPDAVPPVDALGESAAAQYARDGAPTLDATGSEAPAPADATSITDAASFPDAAAPVSTLVCVGSLGDCDGVRSNGCEVDLTWSVAHCGACGRSCPANTNCGRGRCAPCVDGWGDCDGNAANGCETWLGTSVEHCGRCDRRCGAEHRSCVGGWCAR